MIKNKSKPIPQPQTIESLESALITANGKRFARTYGKTLLDTLDALKKMSAELDVDSFSMMMYSLSIGAQRAREHIDMTLCMLNDEGSPSA